MSLKCAISVKKDKQGFCNCIVNGKLRVKQTARIEKTLAVEENLEVYKDVNVHGSIDSKEITTDDLTVNNLLTAVSNIYLVSDTTPGTIYFDNSATKYIQADPTNNKIIIKPSNLYEYTLNDTSFYPSSQNINLGSTSSQWGNIYASRLRLDKTVYPKLEAYYNAVIAVPQDIIPFNNYIKFNFTSTKNTNTTNGFTASTDINSQNSFIYTGTTPSTFNVKYSISLEEKSNLSNIKYKIALIKNSDFSNAYSSSICIHNIPTMETTKLFHGSAYIDLSPTDYIDVRINRIEPINGESTINVLSYSLSAHDMNLSQ
jgi:hypothetical protein